MIYRRLLRPLLFSLDAETAHTLALRVMSLVERMPFALRLLRKRFVLNDPALVVNVMGRRFPTPIGLAAGLDKHAEAFEAFGALGFSFVEVGTITAQAQPGNSRPRLFRLPLDRALINRMGFNNAGASAAANRIARIRNRQTILGVNLGKTKVTPNDVAARDYATSAALLAPHADYVVLNVSSPNTPGLRDLQTVSHLRPLLVAVRATLDRHYPFPRVPLLVKIAPDLADDDVDAIAALALELRLDGIIATNTTIRRDGLATSQRELAACGDGGLSGAPLKLRSLSVLRRLRARLGDQIALIAVGGIENADDAWDRIRAGASLLQIYTAVIFEGPLLARRIAIELAKRTRASGFANISAVVGSELRSRD